MKRRSWFGSLAVVVTCATVVGYLVSAPRAAHITAAPIPASASVHSDVRSIAFGAPLAREPHSIVIDGRTHPERVPDHLAYEHFIKATAIRATAVQADRDRRDAFLRLVGFSPEDHITFVRALTSVKEQLDEIADLRRQSAAAPTMLPAELKGLEDNLVAQTRMRLDQSLSPQGRSELERHIQTHVKSRIVIYDTQHRH